MVVALQEQVKAARQGAAGTMDEYTFVGEGSLLEGALAGGAAPESLSAEQQYRAEMQQELQVCSLTTSASFVALRCLRETFLGTVLNKCFLLHVFSVFGYKLV